MNSSFGRSTIFGEQNREGYIREEGKEGSSQQIKAVAFPRCVASSGTPSPSFPEQADTARQGEVRPACRGRIGIFSAFPFSLQLQILPTPQFFSQRPFLK